MTQDYCYSLEINYRHHCNAPGISEIAVEKVTIVGAIVDNIQQAALKYLVDRFKDDTTTNRGLISAYLLNRTNGVQMGFALGPKGDWLPLDLTNQE